MYIVSPVSTELAFERNTAWLSAFSCRRNIHFMKKSCSDELEKHVSVEENHLC
jgi:hypothetical protein